MCSVSRQNTGVSCQNISVRFQVKIHQFESEDPMLSGYNDDAWLDQNVREEMIGGYMEMVKEQITRGFRPNFINFMFNHIPGNAAIRMDVMTAEVKRVHDILTRHIVRRPEAKNWCHLRPVFIGCPDLPVWKHEKELVRNLVVNDGLHFNVMAFVPEEARPNMPMQVQCILWGR